MKTTEQLLEEISQNIGKKKIDRAMSRLFSDCIKACGWNTLNTKMKGKEVWDTIKAGGSVTFGNRDEKGKLTLASVNKALKANWIDFEYQEWDKEVYEEDIDEVIYQDCLKFFRIAVLGKNPSTKWREKYQPYVDEIVAGLTEEALDALGDDGNVDLVQDEELCKLFKETFKHNGEFPSGYDLCLINTKKGDMVLYSRAGQCDMWRVKCDLNDVHSIISCAIECINHCIRKPID